MAQQLVGQAKDVFLASLSSILPLYSAHFEACGSGDELQQSYSKFIDEYFA
ncbi:hypothetical protein ACHAPX_006507 [Trichoderma viride]